MAHVARQELYDMCLKRGCRNCGAPPHQHCHNHNQLGDGRVVCLARWHATYGESPMRISLGPRRTTKRRLLLPGGESE